MGLGNFGRRLFGGGQSGAETERNVANAWESSHSIDPETGQLIGAPGPVPANIGLKWQDIHQQAIWNYRQRLMGASTDYLKGALGNLQRSRPGGGAALESGLYQSLSGNLLQRASMTQPMDLLGDYRRDAEAQARRRARNASYLQLAGSLAGAAITGLAGGMGGGAGTAMAGLAQGAAQGGMQGANAGFAAGEPNMGAGAAAGMQGGASGMQLGGIDPGQVGAYGQALQSGLGPQQQQGPQGAPPAPGAAPAPTGAPAGGPQPEGGGGQQQRQAGPGGAGGMAGGGQRLGSNGDFSPLAAATQAASSPHPLAEFTSLMVKEHMVELLEGDPDWGMLDAAIRRQALARGMAA